MGDLQDIAKAGESGRAGGVLVLRGRGVPRATNPDRLWGKRPPELPTRCHTYRLGFLGAVSAAQYAKQIEGMRQGLHDLGYGRRQS